MRITGEWICFLAQPNEQRREPYHLLAQPTDSANQKMICTEQKVERSTKRIYCPVGCAVLLADKAVLQQLRTSVMLISTQTFHKKLLDFKLLKTNNGSVMV